MEIRKIPVSEINPAPYNPRIDLQPGDSEYEKLKLSIREFGYVEPLVWNERTGNLVGGHQRFKVLMESKPETIDVSVVDLDSSMEKALNLALNKISGDWDEGKLSELLAELQEEEIDVQLTGFDLVELGELLGIENEPEIEVVEDDNFDFEKTLEDLKKSDPETSLGDVWKLGQHILLCGDATNPEHIEMLMQHSGGKANLVVTDPPYNVAVSSDSKKLQEDGQEKILNDDMDAAEFEKFLNGVFKQYATLMADDSAIYVFHPSTYQREFENAMNAHGIVVRCQCIWVKNAPTFGWAQYRFKHEPVFYAHKKKKAPAWYGDRKQTTVWKADLSTDLMEPELPETVWEVSRGDVSKYIHPTQKPLDLLAIPMRNSSRKGDLIVDLFGGSGSTMMTADQMGRRCASMELDPYFCDAIKLRYFEATGIEPELVHSIS
ncbi:site-specific DNA-methyltransferase [Halalkalibacterium halodurans]|uniref:Adenine methyltransferase n=1 Tax=Halalkalibacterium halodurans TaxID=86665 RepID=A0A0M0KMR5_ALKHA|nr:site-specific DNA-methyltransferase [Halalkalibacterium halodurans]TPE70657.1 DNA modification methylase [Halalkalibacterium halodurans]